VQARSPQPRPDASRGFEVSSETSTQWKVSMQKAIRLVLATAILLGMAATANAQSVMKQCGGIVTSSKKRLYCRVPPTS